MNIDQQLIEIEQVSNNQNVLLEDFTHESQDDSWSVFSITAEKHDIWLESSCLLARCHAFLPVYYL